MSEKNLVICDREIGYANALAENIMEREELHVKVYTFTTLEKAILFSKDKKIHIWVVDENLEGYGREVIDAELCLVLIHGGHSELREKEKPIYKYQCASQIIQEIFETYADMTDETFLKEYSHNRTHLEAVYSPVRGIGKTRFAIALGKEMAREEKVLYINMEEYPGFELNGSNEQNMNLGDLLYFMKQNEGNLSIRLQSAVQKMGELDYIPPIYLAMDLKEVTEEEWIEFLKKIASFGFYNRILLDMGECVQGLCRIFKMCDRIYMPGKEDEMARQKIERFEKGLERLGLESVMRKIKQFVLPENVEEFARTMLKEEE